jgi:hypothetical protein
MRWLEETEIDIIKTTLKFFLFEFNDWDTRERVQTTLNSMLSDLEVKEAIYAYYVKCDWRNNPPRIVDANLLITDVTIYNDAGNWQHHRFVLGAHGIDVITQKEET